MPINESFDIKIMRLALQGWPLPRGKGVLLRLFRPFLRRREFMFEFGKNVLVPGRMEDWLINLIFLEGPDPAFRLSWSVIRPGDTVVDVGGNIGVWCMTAARNCGEAGTVHAFEPHEGNYKRLQENLAVNQIRNVRAHRVAASDCAGEAQFFAPTNGNSGLGRLAARPGVLAPEGKVQTVTLDNYLAELGVRSIGFLKIDVEGAEAMVLAGARRYLKEAEGPIIMFEMNPDLSSAFNKTARDIGELLRNCGYKVFEYVHGELVDVDMDHVQGHHDLFALKPAHASRSALFKGLF